MFCTFKFSFIPFQDGYKDKVEYMWKYTIKL